jgi:hypothetical protein
MSVSVAISNNMIITTRKRTNIARYLQKLCQFYAVLQTPDVVTQQYAPKQLKIKIQTKGQYSCKNCLVILIHITRTATVLGSHGEQILGAEMEGKHSRQALHNHHLHHQGLAHPQ